MTKWRVPGYQSPADGADDGSIVLIFDTAKDEETARDLNLAAIRVLSGDIRGLVLQESPDDGMLVRVGHFTAEQGPASQPFLECDRAGFLIA